MTADLEFHSRDEILAAARPFLDAHAIRLVRFGLEHSTKNLTVESAAKHLGIHRRALEYRGVRAGLVPPQRMLAWCRALHAAELLGRTEATTERIAEVVGYSSADALRKAWSRLGLKVSEVRTPGGPRRAVLSFATELRRASASERSSRS